MVIKVRFVYEISKDRNRKKEREEEKDTMEDPGNSNF